MTQSHHSRLADAKLAFPTRTSAWFMKRKDYASQVQLRALRKGPLISKLDRVSPRWFMKSSRRDSLLEGCRGAKQVHQLSVLVSNVKF
eukprot:1152901-Pelagomonas_calceolata.AAC.7